MLKPENIKYCVYVKLSGQQREDIDFYLKYGNYDKKDYLSNVKLNERSFFFVKRLQQAIIDQNLDDFFNILFEIEEYAPAKINDRYCFEVVKTFEFLIDETVNLLKMESETLSSKVPSTDYGMYFEQIDFSVFPSYYTQLRSLAGEDITKFDAIKNMRYDDCIVELIYRQKQADVNTLITNSHKK